MKRVNLLGAVALFMVVQVADSFAVSPHLKRLELYQVPGMYFYSDDGKATHIPRSILTEDMRAHISRARWTKGQYKLPDRLFGFMQDLDGDALAMALLGDALCWGGRTQASVVQDAS